MIYGAKSAAAAFLNRKFFAGVECINRIYIFRFLNRGTILTATKEAFNEPNHKMFERVWYVLSHAMSTTLEHGRNNNFPLPRKSARRAQRRGTVMDYSNAQHSTEKTTYRAANTKKLTCLGYLRMIQSDSGCRLPDCKICLHFQDQFYSIFLFPNCNI